MTVPLYMSGANYGAISSLKIRSAAVFAGCEMTVGYIKATFYKDSALVETIDYTEIGVSTVGLNDPVAREQILTITPSRSDNNKVEITAIAKLVLDGIEIPDPSAVYAQIYVFAA